MKYEMILGDERLLDSAQKDYKICLRAAYRKLKGGE